jgi:CubicO group peptidase (beta-lactamase class C family)
MDILRGIVTDFSEIHFIVPMRLDSHIRHIRNFFAQGGQILSLLSAFLLVSCLPEALLKQPFVSLEPRELNDGWEVSSPAQEGINPEGLRKIYEEFHTDNALWQVRSLLVFRNGKLVAETYTKDPADATTPRAVWSCTKQVMGIITGIAIDKALIRPSDSLGQYLPEARMYAGKSNIKLHQLLSMKSGILFQNDGLSGQTQALLRRIPKNSVEFILSLPLRDGGSSNVADPTFHYNDGDPHLLSAVLQARIGESVGTWARRVLFEPLAIHRLEWLEYKDGRSFGGFGILTTPRELAKFGQLVLDSGVWKGRRIVSREWIREMLTERASVPLYASQFGYLWWLDSARNVVNIDGHGGQYVFVVPKKNLLVVMTAEVNTQGNHQFLKASAVQWLDNIIAITQ